MSTVIIWILAFITAVAPPGRKLYYPHAQETREEAMVRYNDIAQDVVEVVYDSNTKPLFRGKTGRARTVSVILSIMFHESGFRKDVDLNLGKYARGDKGNSWCLMQLNIGTGRTLKWNKKHNRRVRWDDPPEEIHHGYTGPELIADRKLCIREGLRVLRLSMGGCRKLPLNQRLRAYASGNCKNGAKQSEVRMGTAMRWYAKSRAKRQFVDSDILASVTRLQQQRAAEEAARKKREAERAKKSAEGPVAQK
jgi:hypothetical protein